MKIKITLEEANRIIANYCADKYNLKSDEIKKNNVYLHNKIRNKQYLY